jgi:hypothetical protein
VNQDKRYNENIINNKSFKEYRYVDVNPKLFISFTKKSCYDNNIPNINNVLNKNNK